MKPSGDTNTVDAECEHDDADESIRHPLVRGPLKKPLSAEVVDLIEEFKGKYRDILIDDNNHEIDHCGG